MMPAHEDVGPKQKLPCMDCKLLVPRDGIQHHHDFMCVNSPVQCPLECRTLLPWYVDISQFLDWTIDFSKHYDMVHESDEGLSLFFTRFKLHNLQKKKEMLNWRPAKEFMFHVFNAFLSQSIKIRWSEEHAWSTFRNCVPGKQAAIEDQHNMRIGYFLRWESEIVT